MKTLAVMMFAALSTGCQITPNYAQGFRYVLTYAVKDICLFPRKLPVAVYHSGGSALALRFVALAFGMGASLAGALASSLLASAGFGAVGLVFHTFILKLHV